MIMPTVSLAMIVKNEAANLARCLESVQGQVDEIIIVDTGSEDDTILIAHKYTHNIRRFTWEDNFSSARNYALDLCTCEWILILDADEELAITTSSLKEIIVKKAHADVVFLPLHCVTEEDIATNYLVLRLLRNNRGYRYTGKVHEQIMLNQADSVHLAETPVIRHYPAPKQKRNRKRHRNIRLLKHEIQERGEQPVTSLYLGLEWLGLGNFGKAAEELAKAHKHISGENKMVGAQITRNYISALRNCHRLSEAACLCLEMSRQYPDYTDLFFEGGVVFEELGEYEVALKWFKAAVESGVPPSLYPHTCGTESFLAFYHTGRCCQKLLKPRHARLYYEKALSVRPDYLYPLPDLFQLLQTQYEPADMLRYFREMGFLRYSDSTDLIAWLFYTAGYPQYAHETMRQLKSLDKEQLNRLVKYLVYSANFAEAFIVTGDALRFDRELCIETGVDLTVAAILQGDYMAARSLAMELWRNPAKRSQGWTLLKLIRFFGGSEMSFQAEKHRHKEIVSSMLNIVDSCLKLKAICLHDKQMHNRVAKVVRILLSWIEELSADGVMMTEDFWLTKAVRMRELLDIQCLPARDFYK